MSRRRPARRLAGRRARHPRRQERGARGLRRRPQPRPSAARTSRTRCAPPRPPASRVRPRVRRAPADLRRGLRRRPRPRARRRDLPAHRRLLGRGRHRPASRPGPSSPCTAPPAWRATSTSTARSARAPPTCASAYADDPGCRGTAYRSSAEVRDHVAACAPRRRPERLPRHRRRRAWTPCSTGYEAAAALVGLDAVRAHPPPARARRDGRPRGHRAGWRGSGWSRVSSRPSTPSGAAAAGMYAARLGRERVPGTNPYATMAAAGVRLALGSDSPSHAVRPVGHRARGRRAPRGRPAPRHGDRVRRAHRRWPPGRPRGRGRGPAGRRPGDVRRVGRAGDRRRTASPSCAPGRRCRPVGSPCATASPCTGWVAEPPTPEGQPFDRSCCLCPVAP